MAGPGTLKRKVISAKADKGGEKKITPTNQPVDVKETAHIGEKPKDLKGFDFYNKEEYTHSANAQIAEYSLKGKTKNNSFIHHLKFKGFFNITWTLFHPKENLEGILYKTEGGNKIFTEREFYFVKKNKQYGYSVFLEKPKGKAGTKSRFTNKVFDNHIFESVAEINKMAFALTKHDAKEEVHGFEFYPTFEKHVKKLTEISIANFKKIKSEVN